MIVPVEAESHAEVLTRLREIRAVGDVPLILDPRWPDAHRAAILYTASTTEVPAGAAWATATSGSSGTPRLVVRSAQSWSHSFDAVSDLLGGNESRVFLPAPASSSLTLFSLAHALDGGPQLAQGLAEATSIHATPQGLRAALDSGDAKNLRHALTGGSHLDPALRDRAEQAGIRVTSYYGAAELSFVALDSGDGLRAFPGVEVRVIEDELWVRSPFTALGYLGAGGPLRRDGEWASVGDRAELVEGRIRLLGRADDAILSASATIIPEEVEAILRSATGVSDAVVFGWPRPGIGALVAAFIEGEQLDLTSIRQVCERELAPAHRPKLWFTGVLPRTASGKPARKLAAELAIAGEVERIDA